MQNERVVIGEEGAGRTVRQAQSIVVPDVRPLAVFLDDVKCKVVLWSHVSALVTLERIVRRQRWISVREPFEIDVPDLDTIAKGFPREEQALLVEFWKVYDGLVRHFLPKATARVYCFDGVRAGVRHHGLAWYSPEPKR
jgi:hypothetical protein